MKHMLGRAFDAGGLRRFVASLPSTRVVASELPAEGASLAALVDAFVEGGQRHNIFDEDFYTRLIEARPRWRATIEAIRAAHQVAGVDASRAMVQGFELRLRIGRFVVVIMLAVLWLPSIHLLVDREPPEPPQSGATEDQPWMRRLFAESDPPAAHVTPLLVTQPWMEPRSAGGGRVPGGACPFGQVVCDPDLAGIGGPVEIPPPGKIGPTPGSAAPQPGVRLTPLSAPSRPMYPLRDRRDVVAGCTLVTQQLTGMQHADVRALVEAHGEAVRASADPRGESVTALAKEIERTIRKAHVEVRRAPCEIKVRLDRR